MNFQFLDPWHGLLPRQEGHVVAFMGSGGKTSLMRAVASVYAQEAVPVVLTTTTRCEILPDLEAIAWPELSGAAERIGSEPIFVHAGGTADGKWRGITPDQVDGLGRLLPRHVVLVEVDGAAKMPLKFYRSGEPVWPARTSLAFVTMGTGAVGGQAHRKIHRWGREVFPPLAELAPHTVLTWAHLSRLLFDDGGYLAQVPAGVPTVLALGGLADQDDSIGLFEFVGEAMENAAFPLAVFCAETQEGLSIRAACVDMDESL